LDPFIGIGTGYGSLHYLLVLALCETSVSDRDLCGSVLKWPPRIQIRIGNTDPDPGQSKWCSKREKNLRFQVKKSIDHFAEGMMDFYLILEDLNQCL